MALTPTFNLKQGTVYTLNAAASRGQGWTRGTMNASGTLYAGGGVTCTMPFVNTEFVSIEPRMVTATTLFFSYGYTTGKVSAFSAVVTTTAGAIVFQELASDTDWGAFTAIKFTAWGYD